MKDPDDKDSPGRDISGGDSSGRHRSNRVPGGVQHDSRGNAVWQWAAESGRHLIDSTSRLLKRLEVPGLNIEGEGPEAEKRSLELAEQKKTGGYNPYETTRLDSKARSDARPGMPRSAAPSAPKPPAAPTTPMKSAPPAVKPPARSWLGKVFGKD